MVIKLFKSSIKTTLLLSLYTKKVIKLTIIKLNIIIYIYLIPTAAFTRQKQTEKKRFFKEFQMEIFKCIRKNNINKQVHNCTLLYAK